MGLFCLLMVKMAADDTVSASHLFEGDIPGASPQGQNPTTLTTDEVHRGRLGQRIKNKGIVTCSEKVRIKLIDVFLSCRINKKGFCYLVKRISY